MKVALVGAGRMGQEVVRALCEDDEVCCVVAHSDVGADIGELAGIGAKGVIVQASLAGIEAADVVVDFSLPAAAAGLFAHAAAHALPVVSGTTGLGAEALAARRRLGDVVPLVWAPNFSQGVAILAHSAARAAVAAGGAFDVEIVEMHHRHKRDSPSGTARFLAERVGDARGASEDDWVHGRQGDVGPRSDGEIGVLSLRGGSVVGDHTVILAGPGERIELTHRAEERAVFAHGALRAARWVRGKPPGLYGMEDVMGFTAR